MEPLVLKDIAILLPEIFVILSAIVLLMLGVFTAEKMCTPIISAAGVVLGITCYLLILNLPDGRLEFMHMFIHDSFTTLGKGLVALAALLTLIIAMPWLSEMRTSGLSFRFYSYLPYSA